MRGWHKSWIKSSFLSQRNAVRWVRKYRKSLRRGCNARCVRGSQWRFISARSVKWLAIVWVALIRDVAVTKNRQSKLNLSILESWKILSPKSMPITPVNSISKTRKPNLQSPKWTFLSLLTILSFLVQDQEPVIPAKKFLIQFLNFLTIWEKIVIMFSFSAEIAKIHFPELISKNRSIIATSREKWHQVRYLFHILTGRLRLKQFLWFLCWWWPSWYKEALLKNWVKKLVFWG